MGYLSEAFKILDVFNREFVKIFKREPFDKPNILRYINSCTNIILTEARKKYPKNELKFINPIFIINKEIYPVPALSGDEQIMDIAYEAFNLISSQTIVPLSLKVLDSRLFGLCLYLHDSIPDPDYVAFRTFDLRTFTSNNDKINRLGLIEKVSHLDADVNNLTGEFHKLAAEFDVISTKDKIKFYKTLMLYKSMARLSDHGIFFSFINSYNQEPSFFNCLFTLVSEKPFAEHELVDFALMIDAMAAPIARYYREDPKGVSEETMAKRSTLKLILEKSFNPLKKQ